MILLIPLGLVMGLFIVLHVTMNANVGNITGNPQLSNSLFWLIGFLTTLIIGVIKWDNSFFKSLSSIPKWLLLAGMIGSFLALGMNFMIPKLGASASSILVIVGQLVGGAIISHYGLLGSYIDKFSINKAFGLMMIILGSVLAIYGKIPLPKWFS
jgi:transporter family-2 protein